MEFDGKSIAGAATPIRRPRRLWLWFAGGFLIAFVGMLLLVRMIVMHSSGQYAVEIPLWQYYADALPRLLGPSTLGPSSANGSALPETALFHLLLSAAAGGAAAAVGWCILKFRKRGAAE
jgi:hypothetical protein